MSNAIGDLVEENYKLKEEIERLNKELEIAKGNEETYRLEMLDITKRLGLEEDTIFDEVKDKAEKLQQRINKAINYIEDNSTDTYLLKSFDIDMLLEILKGE